MPFGGLLQFTGPHLPHSPVQCTGPHRPPAPPPGQRWCAISGAHGTAMAHVRVCLGPIVPSLVRVRGAAGPSSPPPPIRAARRSQSAPRRHVLARACAAMCSSFSFGPRRNVLQATAPSPHPKACSVSGRSSVLSTPKGTCIVQNVRGHEVRF